MRKAELLSFDRNSEPTTMHPSGQRTYFHDTLYLERLYLDEATADIHFEFKHGREIERVPAHKCILAKASPVFQQMLFGMSTKKKILKIVGSTAEMFREFFKLFYLSHISLDDENIASMMDLCEKYQVEEGKNACKKYLERDWNAAGASKQTEQAYEPPKAEEIQVEPKLTHEKYLERNWNVAGTSQQIKTAHAPVYEPPKAAEIQFDEDKLAFEKYLERNWNAAATSKQTELVYEPPKAEEIQIEEGKLTFEKYLEKYLERNWNVAGTSKQTEQVHEPPKAAEIQVEKGKLTYEKYPQWNAAGTSQQTEPVFEPPKLSTATGAVGPSYDYTNHHPFSGHQPLPIPQTSETPANSGATTFQAALQPMVAGRASGAANPPQAYTDKSAFQTYQPLAILGTSHMRINPAAMFTQYINPMGDGGAPAPRKIATAVRRILPKEGEQETQPNYGAVASQPTASMPEMKPESVGNTTYYVASNSEICTKLVLKRRQSSEMMYNKLLALEGASGYIGNDSPFECGICYTTIETGGGVTLRNCLHQFCVDCCVQTVMHSESIIVQCPTVIGIDKCCAAFQDREIRALLSNEQIVVYETKMMSAAEGSAENAFHCRRPNCRAWCELADNLVSVFVCQACNSTNCINCRVSRP